MSVLSRPYFHDEAAAFEHGACHWEMSMTEKKTAKSQIEKFQDLARKIGTEDSEQPLNEAIRKTAGVKRKDGEPQWKVTHIEVQDDGTRKIVGVEYLDELN